MNSNRRMSGDYPLKQLDANNLPPRFDKRRSSLLKRTSLAPSGARLLNSSQATLSSVKSRKSLPFVESSAQSHKRKLSGNETINKRLSMAIPDDPRPIRSHQYQEKMRNDIFAYLQNNGFEQIHPLRPETLLKPTQKDILFMFRFLFLEIDPNIRFSDSIENDIYQFLKVFEYPYEIPSRTQLSAVGPTKWPIVMSILHWLVSTAAEFPSLPEITFNGFDEEKLIRAIEDNPPVTETATNLHISYIITSAALHSLDNNGLESFELVDRSFDSIQGAIDKLTYKVDSINHEVVDLAKIASEIEDYQNRNDVLDSDLERIEEFIVAVNSAIERSKAIISKKSPALQQINDEIENLKTVSRQLTFELESKGTSEAEIKKLSTSVNSLESKVSGMKAECRSLETVIEEKLESVKTSFGYFQSSVKSYSDRLRAILEECNPADSARYASLQLLDCPESYEEQVPILPNFQYAEFSGRLNELRLELEETVFNKSQTLDNVNGEVSLLQEQIQTNRKDIEQLEIQIKTEEARLKEDRDKKTRESNELATRTNSIKNETRSLISQTKSLVQEIAEMKAKIVKHYDGFIKDLAEEFKEDWIIADTFVEYANSLDRSIQSSLFNALNEISSVIDQQERMLGL
ncbi:unnamed protein product [Kuraishia capsulata CBS 1993]|uniref:Kinetochore protein NDC80 n=1 Tax=Kuraishia capsulata CBS 1993 TaxID=1382522 RepID=W6MNG4_9ASCO|nr:uncharacterized protein KUCA_T00004186001 [Kuraishia capsulata CBS 1993]CDK28204.1 unnamed protein product [Kuraishia capsulata CBS 1993]